MGKTLSVLLCLFLSVILLPLPSQAYAEPEISAASAIVMNAADGTAVYERRAHERLPMASITKIMTAVAALENADPDTEVAVPDEAVGIEGSSIYLKRGERFTLRELLYALMLESANDASVALAVAVAGSTDAFVRIMNEKAESLGMDGTHFANPNGLPDREHYTTASDFARLTAYALENRDFADIVSTYRYDCGCRVFINHNKLLLGYDGCIGVKTGYTKSSGRCLVSAAERDGLRFIAVTLNDPDDWRDHKKLLDLAFSEYSRLHMADPGELSFSVPIIGGEKGSVLCENKDPVDITVRRGSDVTYRICLKRFYYADVHRGDALGSVEYYADGVRAGTAELYAVQDSTAPRRRGLFQRIADIFRSAIGYI